MAQTQLDILAVGDVTTDAFIKLSEDQVKLERTNSGQQLAIPFRTKIPFESSDTVPAAGNAANAAVAFTKLGLRAGLVSNVGSDAQGREILAALDRANVDSRFVHINSGEKSNYHYILWYKEDRTILINHVAYDYHWPNFRIIDIPKWIYFSSLGKNTLEYHDQLVCWLERHEPVKLAFQPGTFQLQTGADRLKKLYGRSEILAVNREEAAKISGGRHENIHELLDKLHGLGPKIVLISDGPDGAYASDGANRYKMPIYPDPRAPFERTGAGDAFTSTFVAAVAKGADIQSALLTAPINAMSVVQKVGSQAGLLSEHEIGQYLRTAPHSYHPEKI
jgi:sugar/nucleoside kinase (ribokinase family)